MTSQTVRNRHASLPLGASSGSHVERGATSDTGATQTANAGTNLEAHTAAASLATTTHTPNRANRFTDPVGERERSSRRAVCLTGTSHPDAIDRALVNAALFNVKFTCPWAN